LLTIHLVTVGNEGALAVILGNDALRPGLVGAGPKDVEVNAVA